MYSSAKFSRIDFSSRWQRHRFCLLVGLVESLYLPRTIGSRDKLGQFTLSHGRGGGNRCSGHGSMPGYMPSAASSFASLLRVYLPRGDAPSTFNYCQLDDFPCESTEGRSESCGVKALWKRRFNNFITKRRLTMKLEAFVLQ